MKAAGAGAEAVVRVLTRFSGLPHRLEHVGSVNGVEFFNDSKATNVDSAMKALAAFDNIRWIAGGLAKEGGLGPLAGATGRVRKAYYIGRSAAGFALEKAASMEGLTREALEERLVGLERILARFERVDVPEGVAERLSNGDRLDTEELTRVGAAPGDGPREVWFRPPAGRPIILAELVAKDADPALATTFVAE